MKFGSPVIKLLKLAACIWELYGLELWEPIFTWVLQIYTLVKSRATAIHIYNHMHL